MSALPSRQPLPDALRALALVSVLLVNGTGYLVAPWGAVLGERVAAGAHLDAAVQFLIAAVLQGKGYPMLAFLFGFGLCLAMRQGPSVEAAVVRGRARQRRLRVLGIGHGVFIYFGDILTLYSLVGQGLLRPCREPWAALRRRLKRAVVWALAALLLPLAWGLWPGADELAPAEPTLSQASDWLTFWQVNAWAYLVFQVASLLLAWPVVRLCMLVGIAAARLRGLTHPRWRSARQRWLVRLGLPLVALNLLLAGWAVHRLGTVPILSALDSLGVLVGMLTAAAYLLGLAHLARGGAAAWCRWLAPLGRRTLTLYLAHGLLCALLFTGAGLGLRPGPAAMAAFGLGLWALALAAARWRPAARWPLEAWLAGR